jgi:hypothetical protein
MRMSRISSFGDLTCALRRAKIVLGGCCRQGFVVRV